MSYFDASNLAPTPNADDRSFWGNCAQRRLTFQRCCICSTVTHPPIGICPRCQSMERDWVEAPADARVFSYTWVHTVAHPSIKRSLPYNVALVEFDGLPGVRLITNVITSNPGELAVGDPLLLVWEPAGPGMFVPRFVQDLARTAARTRVLTKDAVTGFI